VDIRFIEEDGKKFNEKNVVKKLLFKIKVNQVFLAP